jgi:lysophospholipase L1-like esterase
MRTRLMWLTLTLTLVMTTRAWAVDPPYYLALGDSLSVGVQPNLTGQLRPTSEGYADDLHSLYRRLLPALQLVKLGCSGETTSSMITGQLSPCSYPAGSQLRQAVAFLQSHPHRVVLITLDIGGDNLLGCLRLDSPIDPTCVADAAQTAADDLTMILATLRTYAPGVLIVGMNYNDPLVAAAVFGQAGQTLAAVSLLATTQFNRALEAVYDALLVPVADVAATFRTNTTSVNAVNVTIALAWTWMSARPPRGPDVHPNAIGYLAIASAFSRTPPVPLHGRFRARHHSLLW